MGNQEIRTLIEMIALRAAQEPGKIAFTFHNEPPCRFGNLWQEINNVGSLLLRNGLKRGDRVLIAIPNSSDFFYAFYGAQRAGGIAVPVFPGSGVNRIIKLADLCAASFIVISHTFPEERLVELKRLEKERNILVLFVEAGSDYRGHGLFPEILADDAAFIQFTSGSTGNPKGVLLTHKNLLINMEQMIAGMQINEEDFFVSWLPVFHDMGLILMTMVPFYLAAGLILLPSGLNYIKGWLRAIEEHRATFTAAPDFAYRLCLIYITDPGNYNLSSLRVALNAAEPVRFSTIKRFEERFNLEHVMLPAYGLAESCVGVCSWYPGREVKVDERGFVSVGFPFPGIEMEISRDNKRAKQGEIGEILVKSPANTIGYFRNPQASKELFAGRGYLRTGDLGYFDSAGDYFIVGRKKNIIIQGGHNIAAREVEEVVDGLPFVRRSAAVGIDRGSAEGEQVYVFIEVRLKKSLLQDEQGLRDLVVDVVQTFLNVFGFRPGRVYLMKPRAIPMTYNGKIKYPLLKEQYLDGSLKEKGLILFPAH